VLALAAGSGGSAHWETPFRLGTLLRPGWLVMTAPSSARRIAMRLVTDLKAAGLATFLVY
jgi:hypothetical protein